MNLLELADRHLGVELRGGFLFGIRAGVGAPPRDSVTAARHVDVGIVTGRRRPRHIDFAPAGGHALELAGGVLAVLYAGIADESGRSELDVGRERAAAVVGRSIKDIPGGNRVVLAEAGTDGAGRSREPADCDSTVPKPR